jgi:hypothetical protein
MSEVQAAPEQAAETGSKSWTQRAAEMRGITLPVPEPGLTDDQTLMEAAALVMSAPFKYDVGGLKFSLEEPTILQIKAFLLPAAVRLKDRLADIKSDEEALAVIQGVDEFQYLMLDCITFENPEAVPDRMAWFNGLKASEGMKLVNAYADGINWHGIIEQGKILMGKFRGASKTAPIK